MDDSETCGEADIPCFPYLPYRLSFSSPSTFHIIPPFKPKLAVKRLLFSSLSEQNWADRYYCFHKSSGSKTEVLCS